ncbi:MAG: hypothetical protein Q4D62_15610 [Planctomycetia bacterium]|nr:hypothetical protein [Planctomycetia bacterium]
MLQWLENIWNLRNIFDKYLPIVRLLQNRLPEILNELDQLRMEIQQLKKTSQTAQECSEVLENKE